MRRSSTLAAGQSNEIGRYEVPRWRGLPALGMGMIMVFFQMSGICAFDMERLKMLVR